MSVTTDSMKTGLARAANLLAASAVAVSVTGTASETVLATVTVPAGAMGNNGGLLLYSTWTTTNSANNKTIFCRFGGPAGTAYLNFTVTTTSTTQDIRRIRNRNSVISQVGGMSTGGTGGISVSGIPVVVSSLNTAAAQDIVFSAQLALTSETITLESYEVWLLP